MNLFEACKAAQNVLGGDVKFAGVMCLQKKGNVCYGFSVEGFGLIMKFDVLLDINGCQVEYSPEDLLIGPMEIPDDFKSQSVKGTAIYRNKKTRALYACRGGLTR